MSKKITVLGSGGTAHVAAATFTLLGHEVTLADLPPYQAALDLITEKGGILLRGNGLTGFAKPQLVTTDVAAAVRTADVILVHTIANRHAEIAEAAAAGLKDGQVFLISPGNAGSIVFHNIFAAKNVGAKVYLAELQGNLVSARITGPAEAIAANGLRPRQIAAFPAKDTGAAIAALEGVIEATPLSHVFETTLNSPNLINHLVPTVLSASKIDDKGKDFKLFVDGFTQAAFIGMEASYAEWKSVLDQLGYWQFPSPLEHLRQVADAQNHPEQETFRNLGGPDSLQHRYVSEDAPTGISLLISLAHLIGVKIPFTEALVQLVSTLNKTDYYGQGRTLEQLGLGGKSIEEVNRVLTEGF